MTPINEVSVGKFCRFTDRVVYVHKNNFKDAYALLPIVGFVPQDKAFDHKVFVYKRIKKWWIERASELLESNNKDKRIDNLTYIENLNILNNYLKPVIVVKE